MYAHRIDERLWSMLKFRKKKEKEKQVVVLCTIKTKIVENSNNSKHTFQNVSDIKTSPLIFDKKKIIV